MLLKHITVRLQPGHREPYLAAQAVWDRETAADPACLGLCTATDPAEPDTLHVLVLWRSRTAYERWMAAEHDRIATLAGADAHYRHLEIRLLDVATAHGRLAAFDSHPGPGRSGV